MISFYGIKSLRSTFVRYFTHHVCSKIRRVFVSASEHDSSAEYTSGE